MHLARCRMPGMLIHMIQRLLLGRWLRRRGHWQGEEWIGLLRLKAPLNGRSEIKARLGW